MKKGYLLLVFLILLSACAPNSNEDLLKIGLVGQDQVSSWEKVIEKAKREGIHAELVLFNDYTQPNLALHLGEIDINAFQHYAFLENDIEENNYALHVLSETFYFPLGLYSKKHTELDSIPQKAQVVIPNDPSNGSRALKLLADQRLLYFDEKESLYERETIKENPFDLEIIEMDAAMIPSTLNEVDFAIINAGVAVDNGLKPLEDALVLENPMGENRKYVNIIVSRKEDAKNQNILKLIDLYHQEDVYEIVDKETSGSAIMLNR